MDPQELARACSDAMGADDASRAAQAALLKAHIRSMVGIGVDVAVADPGSVERSMGKARRIADKRPKDKE